MAVPCGIEKDAAMEEKSKFVAFVANEEDWCLRFYLPYYPVPFSLLIGYSGGYGLGLPYWCSSLIGQVYTCTCSSL